jgi:hypothetical protein
MTIGPLRIGATSVDHGGCDHCFPGVARGPSEVIRPDLECSRQRQEMRGKTRCLPDKPLLLSLYAAFSYRFRYRLV